jgi:hypothetical protein
VYWDSISVPNFLVGVGFWLVLDVGLMSVVVVSAQPEVRCLVVGFQWENIKYFGEHSGFSFKVDGMQSEFCKRRCCWFDGGLYG